MGRKVTNTAPDAVIARLAGNQHGVVSLAELEQAGIHERGRRSRAASQRLHRIHRGVYALGHSGLSEKGRRMAAALACGPDAVLSHTSAAALWQLLPQRGSMHVTAPGNAGSRQGIRVHRSRTLVPSGVTRRAGIPVTTPSRTLTDLRRLLPQPGVNHSVGRFTVDFLWRAEYLIVELDGYRAHAAALHSKPTEPATWSSRRWATRSSA